MKNFFLILILTLISIIPVFAQTEKIDPKTGFPVIEVKPFEVFTEGVSFAQVNRVEILEDRSNFVRENYMIGASCSMISHNMKPTNHIIRISAYYPFYNTFNGMRQYPKQTLLYAADLFAGLYTTIDMWKYVNINFAGGLHYMYQLTDEYHMHYFGGAIMSGLDLPIAKRWNIALDGTVTLDYPNFGTNRRVQPFDMSWQYHLDFGVRYSRKNLNKYSYINSKPKAKQKLSTEQ